MKRSPLVFIALLALAVLATACSLFNPAAPSIPTPLPAPPNQIQTAVAATLTAVAPTTSASTPVPPPTQNGIPTANPNQPTVVIPTPTPGGEGNLPTVQLLAPANGAQITTNQVVAVVGLTSDDSGITHVEFIADNVLQDTQAPPNNPTTFQAAFQWSSNQVGTHTLTLIAYDASNNASTPASVQIAVNADTTPPQVSILAPPSPQNIGLGAQLTIQTVASDAAGVTQIQMLVDNQPYSQTNSQNPQGQSPFAASFIYAANVPGTHAILFRAMDSVGNVGTSNTLTVNVADNTPPGVTTNYSRFNVRQNEQVIVYTNATDAAGIQRVELWADNALYNVYSSPNPPAQQSLAIQQIWTSNNVGNHVLFVRVYDVNNQATTTPATNIFVRQPNQPTPTFTPYIPPPTARPTRTPRPVIPSPNCQLDSPNTNFRTRLPDAVGIRWTCNAQGGVADMTVYVQYSGTMATIIDQVPGDGSQQQGGAFDWRPDSAGVVSIFVEATDRLGQRGESPHIPGVIEQERPPTIPPPPTEEPQRPTIAGRWRGDIDNGFFIINLEPRIGCTIDSCAWGGAWEDHRGEEIVTGELNGQLSGDSLTLRMEGGQPGDVTWTFEGQVQSDNAISGNWTESRAGLGSLQQGTVTFVR